MNLKDKTFTGKVSEWGLPDGTVMSCDISPFDFVVMDNCTLIDGREFLPFNYKIKSLPDGYQLNDTGEIVKVEPKRYWDGKEPLEVGMVGLMSFGECEIKLKPDAADLSVIEDLALGRYHHVNIRPNDNFKPIDTRTDKEKAIDEIMKETKDFDLNCIIEYCYDKWVGKDE